MKMDEEGPKYRSIEVKGMNGLSIQYIKRYFSYAGQVEDVKKLDESVIVVIISSFRNSNTFLMCVAPINLMGVL